MRLKNQSFSLGQFLIDLTPLLDVIFILLIVVLTYQDGYIKDADDKKAEADKIVQMANDAKAKAESSNETAQEQLDTYANIHDYVNVVTVYASYTPSNIKYRTLHVEINNNDIWEKEINPSNEQRVWEECRTYIEEKLTGLSAMPTVFSIMNEKMLYRDEQAILSLYGDLNIENKFEKNYMETDDE